MCLEVCSVLVPPTLGSQHACQASHSARAAEHFDKLAQQNEAGAQCLVLVQPLPPVLHGQRSLS